MDTATDEVDLLDDDDLGFVPHRCVECEADVPGSPDDCEVICARCGRDGWRL